ncbi:MAG: hypothetical protein LAO51_04850 [Acidobacteriia bacterium]|nr:hypothetical protein [Terriglobia bacterium]
MKPPRPIPRDTSATEGLLLELSTAVKSGRLVSLLTGNRLTKHTVEELERPESAAKLREILTDHLLSTQGPLGPDPESPPCRTPSAGGKVLMFKARAPRRP